MDAITECMVVSLYYVNASYPWSVKASFHISPQYVDAPPPKVHNSEGFISPNVRISEKLYRGHNSENEMGYVIPKVDHYFDNDII